MRKISQHLNNYMIDLSNILEIPSVLRAIYQTEGISNTQALVNVLSRPPFNFNQKQINNVIEKNRIDNIVFQVVGVKRNAHKISITNIFLNRSLSKRAQLADTDIEKLGKMSKKEYWEMTFNLYDSYGNRKVRHKRNHSHEEAMQNLYKLRQSPYVKNLKIKHYIEFSEGIQVA